MSFKLTVLGSNSAIPSISRFTTSQALQVEGRIYLIDAGEGVQIRLNDFKIKRSKIHQIFISHLHGDHFFGLPGILTSMNLNGRTKPLQVFGPRGLKDFIDTLVRIGSLYLDFKLEVNEIDAEDFHKIFEDNLIEVYALPLKHRVPTTGFVFKEKLKPRKIRVDKIDEYNLTIAEIKSLKAGKDITRGDNEVLFNSKLTSPPPIPSTYAFCSDTIYDEDLIPHIKGAQLLYHEATYLDEFAEKARERGHSTALEAAKIAKKAEVKQLLLGHYSSRYKDISPFKEEAEEQFKNVSLADDGREFHF